jgi:hypothetical protein
VDQSTNVTDAEIEFYLDQLENWKKLIPLDAKKQVDRESIAFDGYDYYGKSVICDAELQVLMNS